MVGREESLDDNPGLAVIDLSHTAREQVITLGGRVVIDARDKLGVPGYPHGHTNREAFDKHAAIIDYIRRVFTTALFYGDQDWQKYSKLAFIEKMLELGFAAVTAAKIKGKIPPHWDPSRTFNVTFVLGTRDVWEQKKQALDNFARQLPVGKSISTAKT